MLWPARQSDNQLSEISAYTSRLDWEPFLHGTDSPLPSYYVDEVAYEHAQSIGVRPAYFNFFNHRLHTLLHQGWRHTAALEPVAELRGDDCQPQPITGHGGRHDRALLRSFGRDDP